MTREFLNRKKRYLNSSAKSKLAKLIIIPLSFVASVSHAIDAPSNLSCSEAELGGINWSWGSVSNAAYYDVIVNKQFVAQSTSAEHFSSGLSAGSHTLSVKAISSNWDYSASSSEFTCNLNASPAQAQSVTDDSSLIDPQTWEQTDLYKDKSGYELVFSDEFNGDRLSPTRWNTQLRWDGSFNGERYEYRTINGEDQFYVNILSEDQNHLDKVASSYNPFEFDGNRLAIRAVRNPLQTHDGSNGYGPLDNMVGQQPFLSGAMTTYDKFSQKYGYFEARIKIPSQLGTFPAFWLHHQRREWENTQRTEIDIMENLGHAPWYVYNSFHYFTGVAEGVTGTPHHVKPQPEGQIYTGIDYSEDYHVYSVEWEPGYINYMIDGQTVSEVWNDNANHEELYILINLAIGGNWTNYPSNAGGTGREQGNHFPNQNDLDTWSNPALEIDYVRAWKRN